MCDVVVSCCSYECYLDVRSATEIARTDYLKGLVCLEGPLSAWTLCHATLKDCPLRVCKTERSKKEGSVKKVINGCRADGCGCDCPTAT